MIWDELVTLPIHAIAVSFEDDSRTKNNIDPKYDMLAMLFKSTSLVSMRVPCGLLEHPFTIQQGTTTDSCRACSPPTSRIHPATKEFLWAWQRVTATEACHENLQKLHPFSIDTKRVSKTATTGYGMLWSLPVHVTTMVALSPTTSTSLQMPMDAHSLKRPCPHHLVQRPGCIQCQLRALLAD